ncbi:hypothetical protein AKJ57_03865 [candidate division MSBL1 archaeon SCGC-AAA259A05]|uniref:SIS domain-containing protein n=1 Tax=candidate division MSBL1 archaeon SCGC-AAA259A05 TaxID=1698259 RepID=A0A133U988_9EURY|nr:hypothetical protein AKJ57_03865 [candidate division MSBL1 archaeon SCGC-AAA259A05]
MRKGELTRKEIEQQPSVWSSALVETGEKKERVKHLPIEPEEVIFYGSGSSHYSALSASMVYQELTGVRSRGTPPSEIFLFPRPFTVTEEILVFPISRSGTTTETIEATTEFVNNHDAYSIGFTCHPDSDLAETVDFCISIEDAREESVVQTKSFTSMLIALQRTASTMGENEKFFKNLEKLPAKAKKVIRKSYDTVGKMVDEDDFHHFVFLGGGPLYGIAMESMLKMEEMVLEHTEGYHPLEYRHGPKSMIDDETLITLYASDSGVEYEEDLLRELKNLGATLFVVSENGRMRGMSDYSLELESGLDEFARAPLCVIPAQVMGLEFALNEGVNPDSPRHLQGVIKLGKGEK